MGYTSQILQVMGYLPAFQMQILDLIVTKCLEMDVEIAVDESDSNLQLAEEEDKADDLFELETDPLIFGSVPESEGSLIVSTGAAEKFRASSAADDHGVHQVANDASMLADTLDSLLVLVLEHCDRFLMSDSETAARLTNDLLVIFDRRMLSTHKSKFVQFYFFFVASRKHKFAEDFVRYLLNISLYSCLSTATGTATDDSQRAKTRLTTELRRQTAIAYLASFIARANFLRAGFVR